MINICFTTFTPIEPINIFNYIDNPIIKGKDHEYISMVSLYGDILDYDNKNKIYNPMNGSFESNLFELNLNDIDENDITDFIHPDKIKQIIMINLDESESIKYDCIDDLDDPFLFLFFNVCQFYQIN